LKFSLFFADVVDEDGMSAVESFAENNKMTSGESLIYQWKRNVGHWIKFPFLATLPRPLLIVLEIYSHPQIRTVHVCNEQHSG